MIGDVLVKPSNGSKLGQDLDGIKFQSSPVCEVGLERKAHMKGGEITVQPVQRSLGVCRLFLNDGIRLALRWLIRSRGGSPICLSHVKEEVVGSISRALAIFLNHQRTFTRALTTESTRPSDEDRRLVLENGGAGLLVLGSHQRRYSCGLALIEYFDNPVH